MSKFVHTLSLELIFLCVNSIFAQHCQRTIDHICSSSYYYYGRHVASSGRSFPSDEFLNPQRKTYSDIGHSYPGGEDPRPGSEDSSDSSSAS